MKINFRFILVLILFLILIGLVICLLVHFYNKKDKQPYQNNEKIMVPSIEDVNARINKENTNDHMIPKVVYLTYYDIDGIPSSVIENFKKFCKGYKIEIHGDKSCEDILYKYLGSNAVSIFRKINIKAHKAHFWRYCILYYKGGYYFDIKTELKSHIDEIFKISYYREWFTIICSKQIKSCLYNGIIVTPPKNPILFDALLQFYTHTNTYYLYHVKYLFKLLQNNCNNDIHPGSNIQNNGWICNLFEEKYSPCRNKENCSKHKQQDCLIFNSNKEFANVEQDYPWKKSYMIPSIKLLTINGNKKQKIYSKQSIAIVGTFHWHFECLGFLLDILSENYDIDVYHNDKEGYLDLFSKTYNFKSFRIGMSDIDALQYKRCIILTEDDPIIIKNCPTTRIVHHLKNKKFPYADEWIKLSPLVKYDAKYILPVYRTCFSFTPRRNKTIVVVGDGWKKHMDLLYNIVKHTDMIVNVYSRTNMNVNLPGINTIVGANASTIHEDISKCKFVLVTRHTDRLSGVIALALSCKTPMIIDSFQSEMYKFPALIYTDNQDLLLKLKKIQEEEYNILLNRVVDYTNSLLEKNRTLCPPFLSGSFRLKEVKNSPATKKWSGKIPYSLFQAHQNRYVTEEMFSSMDTIRASADGASYTFYSNTDAGDYIMRHYPSAIDAYNSLIPGAFRCDLFRIIRLYIQGGVYFDSPYSIPQGVKIFNDIIKPDDEFVSSWDLPSTSKSRPAVYQGFIASVPRHPILGAMIENILDIVEKQEYSDSPLSISGPIMLGRTMKKIKAFDKKGVRLIKHLGEGKIKDKQQLLINTRYKEYDKDRKILQNGMPHYGILWNEKKVYRNITKLEINKPRENELTYESIENHYQKGNYLIWPKQENIFMKENFPSSFDFDFKIKQHILDISKELPKGSAIIDCGAHIGDGSIPIAGALKYCGREDIIVYAIDPNIYKTEFIKDMAKKNDLNNVRIICCGLSDIISSYSINTEIDYRIENGKINSGGTSWVESTNDNEKNKIQFRTLDDLVKLGEIPEKIGYIHLDVEGMEDKAIIGAFTTIQTYSPILSLEDHDKNSYKLDDILKYIGYTRIGREHSNNIYKKV
jgi:FkbM family methyltransferase